MLKTWLPTLFGIFISFVQNDRFELFKFKPWTLFFAKILNKFVCDNIFSLFYYIVSNTYNITCAHSRF